uniref:Peptidase M28 domain-containing protein n=1 Tax=Alexandrium monilatum TaxID=311494 RepID=A0A7S4VV28_9DINO|mmetsp:Transcript_110831/g.346762  ORF Transcript_110831/g.346762 Transcript_110831/m.346762 type:complete len:462 (+) Transcript_110831:97-1482(+)
MRQFALLFLVSCCTAADAASLPRFAAGEGTELKASLEKDGKWWAHLGDHVYHAPSSSSGLSSRVGDYYYAFGSDSALSNKLRDRRVGGEGRLHIFHLPEGPSMLQVENTRRSRRSALSAFNQLKEHMKLQSWFPVYKQDSSYQNPLNANGQELEKLAVSKITADRLMAYLKDITSFSTRSFQNPQASRNVQSFIKKEFQKLNFTTCEHTFSFGGPSTNLVAFAPGSSKTGDVVVMGAHYDDIPAFGHAPGAEDNGSGLAALLGIMRAFQEAGIKTKKSVAFVGFAGEEPGLLGSEAYANSILSSKTNMDQCLPPAPEGSGKSSSFLSRFSSLRKRENFQAIVMDEVGWQSPSLSSPTVNLESYDWTKDLMEHLAQSSKDHNGDSLTVVHSNHPFGSDHMSFLDRRIPAVLTINGDDEAYPFYHSSGDEITQVTGSLVEKIAKMNMGGLLRLAGIESQVQTS